MENNDELQKLLDKYLEKGFGSMNKNDFEVFIFSRLINTCYHGMNDYQLSLKLRIPISKVKRLRYEADLKYPIQKDYKTLFVEAMKGARYDNNEKPIIVFSIEDIALRQYLRDLLMKRGNFYDSSFNSDIVRISEKDFLCLLEDIYFDESKKKEIKSSISKNSNKDIPHLIVQAVAAVAKSMGGNALSELTNIGLEKLIPVIKSLFVK